MHTDTETCTRVVQSRDPRFDGRFVVAVRTTGIYCRPSCPVRPPKPQNMTFHPTAAAAQAAGFRACKRCRPDATPGSPEWDGRADLAARAMRLVADGVVDREGVAGLARRLGYERRQVERVLSAELGAGPLALARARRAATARLLVETTDLPMTEVALAAGFSSVRQFNDTVRAVYASAPGDLRRAAGTRDGTRASEGLTAITVRLPFRAPLLPDNLFGHLAATAVPGIEEWRDGAYRRTLRLPRGWAVAALRPPGPAGPDHVVCTLRVSDLRDLATAIARCRRLLDLDADPVAVDAALGADPALAQPVREAPGRRVPRTVDEAEFALRAVLGQQVSTAAARTHAARLVAAYGTPVTDPDGGLTHLFPTPEELAGLDPARLALPRSRVATVVALVTALAEGRIDTGPGADRDETRHRLGEIPGIGPWTVETVAMRALGDPDAFPVTDLGVRAGAASLGLPTAPAALSGRSAVWRPWRAYAVQHLWARGTHAVNRMPGAA